MVRAKIALLERIKETIVRANAWLAVMPTPIHPTPRPDTVYYSASLHALRVPAAVVYRGSASWSPNG